MAGWGRRKSKRSSSRRHKPAEARRALTAKLRGAFPSTWCILWVLCKKKKSQLSKVSTGSFYIQILGQFDSLPTQ